MAILYVKYTYNLAVTFLLPASDRAGLVRRCVFDRAPERHPMTFRRMAQPLSRSRETRDRTSAIALRQCNPARIACARFTTGAGNGM